MRANVSSEMVWLEPEIRVFIILGIVLHVIENKSQLLPVHHVTLPPVPMKSSWRGTPPYAHVGRRDGWCLSFILPK